MDAFHKGSIAQPDSLVKMHVHEVHLMPKAKSAAQKAPSSAARRLKPRKRAKR